MEISSMRKNSFIRFAVAATAVAVLAGMALPANAAIKPAAAGIAAAASGAGAVFIGLAVLLGSSLFSVKKN